jgi:hypothetical protein
MPRRRRFNEPMTPMALGGTRRHGVRQLHEESPIEQIVPLESSGREGGASTPRIWGYELADEMGRIVSEYRSFDLGGGACSGGPGRQQQVENLKT